MANPPDEYDVREVEAPAPRVDYAAETLRAAAARCAAEEVAVPRPPRWPMLSGVWTFPWYFTSLAAWMWITLGLMVTAWFVMVWLQYGPGLSMTGARLFGPPGCAAGMLTFGYAATCWLAIIVDTSHGQDAVDVSVALEWKEWTWNFAHLAALVLQAGAVGYLVRLACLSDSWLLAGGVALAAFPFVLLGALAGGAAWVPVGLGTVLRSLPRLWWAWALFYMQTTPLIVGWLALVKAGLAASPWPVPLYAAPLAAAMLLIYARLVGRLAGCIAANS